MLLALRGDTLSSAGISRRWHGLMPLWRRLPVSPHGVVGVSRAIRDEAMRYFNQYVENIMRTEILRQRRL